MSGRSRAAWSAPGARGASALRQHAGGARGRDARGDRRPIRFARSASKRRRNRTLRRTREKRTRAADVTPWPATPSSIAAAAADRGARLAAHTAQTYARAVVAHIAHQKKRAPTPSSAGHAAQRGRNRAGKGGERRRSRVRLSKGAQRAKRHRTRYSGPTRDRGMRGPRMMPPDAARLEPRGCRRPARSRHGRPRRLRPLAAAVRCRRTRGDAAARCSPQTFGRCRRRPRGCQRRRAPRDRGRMPDDTLTKCYKVLQTL